MLFFLSIFFNEISLNSHIQYKSRKIDEFLNRDLKKEKKISES